MIFVLSNQVNGGSMKVLVLVLVSMKVSVKQNLLNIFSYGYCKANVVKNTKSYYLLLHQMHSKVKSIISRVEMVKI